MLTKVALPSKTTTTDPRGHNLELDALRGIAILGVVMFHITTGWWNVVQVPLTVPLLRVDAMEVLFYGFYGLPLFFLLSGYLLTWTEEKRARAAPYSVRSYVLRRVLRLAPAYYVAIIITVVLWPEKSSAIDVLMHASFLHAFSPYTVNSLDPAWWSLTPEIVFYCLLPFIVLKLRRVSQRLALFGAFALISLATRLYTYQYGDPFALFSWDNSLPVQIFVIGTYFVHVSLAGVLLRMLVEHFNSRPDSSWLRPWLATALFLIGTASIVVWVFFLGMQHPTTLFLQGNPLSILIGIPVELAVIALFASAVLGSPLLGVLLKWRFLAFSGMISYSMFLLHDMVLKVLVWPGYWVLSKNSPPPLSTAVRDWVAGQGSLAVWAGFFGYTLVILAVVFPLSYLSYRYIERPFLSYRPK